MTLSKTYTYKKVLVIDDNDLDRVLAEKIIKRYHFAEEVVLMDSAEVMLRYLNDFKADDHSSMQLIFLDLNMPDIDGWEFLERFDLMDKNIKDHFKILIVSSSIDFEDKKRALSNKYVVDFISKPLSKEVILRLHAELEQKVNERTQLLTKALEKEKELNQLKSRFVSLASHEFRTPLTIIHSSATLLSKYTLTEDQVKRDEHISRIKSSVNVLLSILNDFLSVSKIEEGKVNVNYAAFNIESATTEIINDLSSIFPQEQLILYKHTGEPAVFLDAALYKFIITNLLSNASKFSPDHLPIYVETASTSTECILSVQDSGIGISNTDKDHLFERFFRGINASNIEGTGLGLHIVAKYTELMNGTIQCNSILGKGTQFVISFAPKKPKS